MLSCEHLAFAHSPNLRHSHHELKLALGVRIVYHTDGHWLRWQNHGAPINLQLSQEGHAVVALLIRSCEVGDVRPHPESQLIASLPLSDAHTLVPTSMY